MIPFFDAASIGLSIEDDKLAGRKYDTLEDSVMEIEELKDELSMIVMTQTPAGRERWDTPEIEERPVLIIDYGQYVGPHTMC